jgi:hypothetical protein
MTTMLRQMLAATGQPAGLPLWITELGAQTAVTPDPKADRHQMSSDLVGHHLRHIDVGENIGLWVQVAERFDHLLSAAHSHQPIMNDGDFHIDRSQPAGKTRAPYRGTSDNHHVSPCIHDASVNHALNAQRSGPQGHNHYHAGC